jgi:phage gpG-like protein
MSGAQVTVIGQRRLSATISRAARDLGDLSAAGGRAAAVIVAAGRGRAPRRTGALAASLTPTATATTATVSSRRRYAAVIHWGWPARRIAAHPFLLDAATITAPVWQPWYQAEIAAAVARVRGA